MDEVEVDVEQRRLALGLGDEVRIPDAIEERLSHLRIVAIRRRARAQGVRPMRYRPPMAERVLSVRDLNRALLARQLLLERSKLPLAKALDRIGGIQAQYAPSSYIGLWSRLPKFELGDLTRALERRRVVQGTLLRSTIHLVSAGDYWAFALGSKAARQEAWLRFDKKRLSRQDMQSTAAAVRKALADRVEHRDQLPRTGWETYRVT